MPTSSDMPSPTSTSLADRWLVADIGGTNARLAWCCPGEIEPRDVRTLACKSFANPQSAIEHYLMSLGGVRPTQAAIAIATPITGDWVQMTNHHWAFSIDALQRALGLDRLLLLNDFTALAWSLPSLREEEHRRVSHSLQDGVNAVTPAHINFHAPVAVLGAGTGLGVSGLFPTSRAPQVTGPKWIAIQGEGGHVTLPAETDLEQQVIHLLQTQWSHVSAERVVSGPGLSWLHAAVFHLQHNRWPTEQEWLVPEQVLQQGLTHHAESMESASLALQALRLFSGWLGCVAGNLALTLGATGGVFIGGGIAPRLGTWLDQSPFHSRMQGKGRFQPYLAPIPVHVITAPHSPALKGAALALMHDNL